MQAYNLLFFFLAFLIGEHDENLRKKVFQRYLQEILVKRGH